jgi:predicted DNA-binding antitoxin AbrB/MazE fold protein
MSLQIEVTYQDGVLKPTQPLPLHEGQKVTIIIAPVTSAAQRFCGSLCWTRDPEELRAYLNDPDESAWGL